MTQIETTYVDHMGSDLSVVNAARVSFGKTSEMDMSDPWGPPKLKQRDAKLIKYLAKHKHISPFGHAFASFHVKAPIFVARQLVKHKFLRWNEISRRYVDDEPEFYNPDVWRGRSADKKQGSEGVVTHMDIGCGYEECCPPDGTMLQPLEDWVQGFNIQAFEDYTTLIKSGVAPEMARMVLPQSTLTEWYWSGSLDAFADMCRLRLPSDTQQETREVAQQISEKMSELFPVSWDALLIVKDKNL
jgi:thymidylate synthase (FAD)